MPATVLLTRPHGRNGSLAGRLAEAGLAVCEAPALEIRVLDTPRPLPVPGNLYLFVSRQAVDAYFSTVGGTWPAGTWAAAVGPATRDALRIRVPGAQILAPSVRAASDSEALLSVIQAQGLAPAQAHILRAQQGRDWMAEQLRLRGWRVTCHALYERIPALLDLSACKILAQDPQCVLLVTSIEALDAIDASLHHHGLLWPDALRAVTLHARMERRLQCLYADKPAGTLQVELSAADDVSLFHAILNASCPSH